MHTSTSEGFRRLTLGDTGFASAAAATTRTMPQLACRGGRRTGAREEDLLALLVSLVDMVGSARVI